jgi:hypothetical protein
VLLRCKPSELEELEPEELATLEAVLEEQTKC